MQNRSTFASIFDHIAIDPQISLSMTQQFSQIEFLLSFPAAHLNSRDKAGSTVQRTWPAQGTRKHLIQLLVRDDNFLPPENRGTLRNFYGCLTFCVFSAADYTTEFHLGRDDPSRRWKKNVVYRS